MKKEELKKYEGKKPIAVYALTNTCAMYILDIVYDIDDHVIIKGYTGDTHKYKIKYTNKGGYFTYCNGCRCYINDFMRM